MHPRKSTTDLPAVLRPALQAGYTDFTDGPTAGRLAPGDNQCYPCHPAKRGTSPWLATRHAWLIFLFFIAVVHISGTTSLAAEDDEWLGADKALHFGVSALLDTGGYWTLREGVQFTKVNSLVLSALATLSLGVAKEMTDEEFSAKDLAWDAAGTGFSTIVWLLGDRRQDQVVVRVSSSFAGIQYQHAF